MSSFPEWSGPVLAALGGSCYAVGALVTSYMAKGRETAPEGWANKDVNLWNLASWCTMNFGGLCVTLGYQSQASVPFLNTIVYSFNLVLNMVFQIRFKISTYTKVLRCGTILFALATVQLSQMAPDPVVAGLEQALVPLAITWWVILALIFLFTGVGAYRTRDLPKIAVSKTAVWAIHIAAWGSITDNWAKINGIYTFASPTWWAIFIPYAIVAAGALMSLSVLAFAQCDVRVFVPIQLCSQLIMNLLSGFMVWEEASRVDNVFAYALTYVICVFSIYVSTEDADLEASFQHRRDANNKALSSGCQPDTEFGEAVLKTLARWDEPPEGAPGSYSEKEQAVGTRVCIKSMLEKGIISVAFRVDHLVDLVMRLWERAGGDYPATGEIITWLGNTDYVQAYVREDPSLASQLGYEKPVVAEVSQGATWLLKNSRIEFSASEQAREDRMQFFAGQSVTSLTREHEF